MKRHIPNELLNILYVCCLHAIHASSGSIHGLICFELILEFARILFYRHFSLQMILMIIWWSSPRWSCKVVSYRKKYIYCFICWWHSVASTLSLWVRCSNANNKGILPGILPTWPQTPVCERELTLLDMAINFKKSRCIRIGSRMDTTSANLCSLTGISIPDSVPWCVHYILRSRTFKCSLSMHRRAFYCSANAIVGKVGRVASDELSFAVN